MTSSSSRSLKLHLREWIAILVLSGFLASIVLIGKFSEEKSIHHLDDHLLASERWIEIEIIGEIQNPGTFRCHPGTTVKELLKNASLSANANRKKIPFKKVLFNPQTLEIPGKKKISLEEN